MSSGRRSIRSGHELGFFTKTCAPRMSPCSRPSSNTATSRVVRSSARALLTSAVLAAAMDKRTAAATRTVATTAPTVMNSRHVSGERARSLARRALRDGTRAAGGRSLVSVTAGVGVLLAELVLVRNEPIAARVELHVHTGSSVGFDRDLVRLLSAAIVPRVHRIRPGGNAGDGEASIRARLRHVRRRYRDDERDHFRVNITEHLVHARPLDSRILALATSVQAEIEFTRAGLGEYVVAERVLVREAHCASRWHDSHSRHELARLHDD